jgi:quercetin dioxygenase-like cupin family protein
MAQQAADHCTNPSEEVIRVGHLTVHFLVPGENSSGTAAVFEIVVPAGQRLIAPAHSHDHYEETVYGIEGVLTWDRGRRSAFGGAPFTGSTTTVPKT